MKLGRSVIALFACCVFAAPVLATESVISLARSGRWQVDHSDTRCRLFGAFGEGDGQIIIQLSQFKPGDEFELVLLGPAMKPAISNVRAAFAPYQDMVRRDTMVGTVGSLPMKVFGTFRLDNLERPSIDAIMPAVGAAREAAVRALEIRLGTRHYHLETGSMAAVMRAMRRCTDGLVTSWGFDPVVQAALSRLPYPSNNPGRWLTTNDYPRDALKSGAMAIVHFRLDVDPAGKPERCSILSATRPAGFDDVSCRLLMQRARFSPALDKDGNPVASFYVNTVRWVLP